ncbi:hypothetical protein Glove_535g2 [Diversispora epigaea]|uniref:Uncharacterized protein n=1 Tax=Diversispora epigaea TaxID=1348612 RepID=A0A397GHS0_9GLOM|nr:hypothetical protein Glove_535g2 [Diversispora epigaea]
MDDSTSVFTTVPTFTNVPTSASILTTTTSVFTTIPTVASSKIKSSFSFSFSFSLSPLPTFDPVTIVKPRCGYEMTTSTRTIALANFSSLFLGSLVAAYAYKKRKDAPGTISIILRRSLDAQISLLLLLISISFDIFLQEHHYFKQKRPLILRDRNYALPYGYIPFAISLFSSILMIFYSKFSFKDCFLISSVIILISNTVGIILLLISLESVLAESEFDPIYMKLMGYTLGTVFGLFIFTGLLYVRDSKRRSRAKDLAQLLTCLCPCLVKYKKIFLRISGCAFTLSLSLFATFVVNVCHCGEGVLQNIILLLIGFTCKDFFLRIFANNERADGCSFVEYYNSDDDTKEKIKRLYREFPGGQSRCVYTRAHTLEPSYMLKKKRSGEIATSQSFKLIQIKKSCAREKFVHADHFAKKNSRSYAVVQMMDCTNDGNDRNDGDDGRKKNDEGEI